MPPDASSMRREALEVPERAAALLRSQAAAFDDLAARWRSAPPRLCLTVARGSSDHAAAYLAFLAMTRLGVPVASVPPSVFSVHASRWQAQTAWAFALSQSGRSPDLLSAVEALRAAGAITTAMVNDASSPLSAAAESVLLLEAGAETSVAATKSFIAQLVAGARLVAGCSGDEALLKGIAALPDALALAQQASWDVGVRVLRGASRLYVLGRGTGHALAQELALKFKEVCGLHAEAFSSAEVQHGPMALVEDGYPILVLAPRGPAQAGILDVAQAMRDRGARVLLCAPAGTPGVELPLVPTGHPELDPIALAQSAYLMVEALSRERGLDPDHPRHLRKVTCTV